MTPRPSGPTFASHFPMSDGGTYDLFLVNQI